LNDSTRKLMNAARIGAMKHGAVLINTARGGIVDEAALAQALREGRLAGAALDVFEREPLPAGSSLAGVPNLVLTPHIAGVTQESNERVSAMIAELVAERLLGPTPTEQSCQHIALPT
jgi:(S)-sulfolactate dehydrogenase